MSGTDRYLFPHPFSNVFIRKDVKTLNGILNCGEDVAYVRLEKYRHLPSHERIQEILNTAFTCTSKKVWVHTILHEALLLTSVFPNEQVKKVVGMLKDFAHETNRVRIVAKILLKKKADALKRKSPSLMDGTHTKKSKTSNDKPSTSTSGSNDSESSNDNSAITCESGEVLQNNQNFLGNLYTNLPSTSNDQDHTDDPIVMESESETDPICESFGTIIKFDDITESETAKTDSQATIILTPEYADNQNDFNFIPGGSQTSEDETAIDCHNDAPDSAMDQTVFLEDTEDSVEVINYHTEELFNPGCSNYSYPQISQAQKPTNSQIKNDYFDFYKYLEKLCVTVPDTLVKEVCRKYDAEQYEKPDIKAFNAIVSELLGHNLENDELLSMYNAIPYEASVGRKISKVYPQVTDIYQPSTSKSCTQTNVVMQTDNVIENVDLSESFPDIVGKIAPYKFEFEEIKSISVEQYEARFNQDRYDSNYENLKGDDALFYPLLEMFPEACSDYVRSICKGKRNDPAVFDELVSQMLESNYPTRMKKDSPKHAISFDEQLETMLQIFPDADPSYLQMHCERLFEQPEELKTFIADMLETRKYPTLKDYLRKQQLSSQQKQYTSEFSVQKFLEVIPDPVAYFSDKTRKAANVAVDGFHYAICFLRNRYPRIPITKIRDVFKNNEANFLRTCKLLDNIDSKCCMRTRRAHLKMPEPIQDIPLLQEIAYIKHYDEIIKYIKDKKLQEKTERDAAKKNGELKTCSCCYDEEVMPKDMYTCEEGCMFCKDCVKKSAEVAFGDGKLDFSCLSNCNSYFNLQTLQAVLNPKMFSIIALKKQLEEVKAAGIEDLEMCPFCDFATIPERDDKLFRCLNPECMKESCRLCKEPSHVPLRCEEVEKETDVKTRTYIENKMTEALIRKCYRCGMKFIKSDGCNKMTCSCGAMMCYICLQPVSDYTHFNGAGGDKFELCPLYSDTNKLHEEDVLEGAYKAKQEVGVDIDSTKLKHDPTTDTKKYYKDKAINNPPQEGQPFVNLNRFFNAHYGRLIVLHQQLEFNGLADPGNNVLPHLQQNALRNQHRHHRHHHHHHYDDHHRAN